MWKKGCLYTFFGLALLGAIGLSMLWFNSDKIVDSLISRGLEVVKQKVDPKLPEGTDKETFNKLFDKLRDRLQSVSFKNLDQEAIQDFVQTIETVQVDKKITSEEIFSIIDKGNAAFFNGKLDAFKMDALKEKFEDYKEQFEGKKEMTGEQVNELLDKFHDLIDSAPPLEDAN